MLSGSAPLFRLRPQFQYLEPDVLFYCPYEGLNPTRSPEIDTSILTLGMRGQVGTETGALIADKGVYSPKGLQVVEGNDVTGLANWMPNPSFETGLAGWTTSGGNILTNQIEKARFGSRSARVQHDGATITLWAYSNFTFAVNQQFVLSAYVWIPTNWTGGALVLVVGNLTGKVGNLYAITTSAKYGSWQRIMEIMTVGPADNIGDIWIYCNSVGAAGSLLYMDGFQIQQISYPTPYADGSRGTGHAWTGVAHASTSTRTAARLTYPNMLQGAAGTVAFWWYPANPQYWLGGNRYFFHEGSAYAEWVGATATIRFSDGTFTLDRAWYLYAGGGVPMHLTFTWGASGLRIYINGAAEASTASHTAFAPGATLNVGSDNAGANQVNGMMDDFLVLDRQLPATEVKTLYNKMVNNSISLGYYEDEVSTCDDIHFIRNAHPRAQINHIYVYDSSAGTWGLNLINTPPPYFLLPATTGIGDCVYFGIDTGMLGGGPFWNLVCEYIASPGVALNCTWEIWNGAAWVAPTIHQNDIGNFAVGGVRHIAYFSNVMTAGNLNTILGGTAPSVTGHWLRARVTAGVVAAPIEINRHPYTINWPYYELNGEDTQGDVTSLAREIEKMSYSDYTIQTLIGTRSLERGEDFDAYLNCTDNGQLPPGVSLTLVHAAMSYGANGYSPTGRVATWAPVGAVANFTELFYFKIDAEYAWQYQGTYRLFLRGAVTVANDIKLKIIFAAGVGVVTPRSNEIYYTDVYSVNLVTAWLDHAMEFGIFPIPPRGKALAAYDEIYIKVMGTSVAGAADLNLIDLVLLPIDEYAVESSWQDEAKTYNPFINQTTGDLDCVTYPKESVVASVYDEATGISLLTGKTLSKGLFQYRANVSQRAWIIHKTHTYQYSSPIPVFMVNSDKVSRYLSMRGDR